MNKTQLIDALNEDLATEFQAVAMYTVYSAKVKGPWRQQLADFMQAEVPDELQHAQFLADKISALGASQLQKQLQFRQPTPLKRCCPRSFRLKRML